MMTSPSRHKDGCQFGSGFYRIELEGSMPRYCQDEHEVEWALRLLKRSPVTRVARDGYCLDGLIGDANTPDVVDAEWWLGLDRAEAMQELGLHSEQDYARAYRAIEAAVGRRNDRASQTGVRASIVIKRPGAAVTDA